MNGPVIRSAITADCDRIAEIIKAYRSEASADPPNSDDLRNAVLETIASPSAQILVAESVPDIVGYIAVHWISFPMLAGREGYITDLLVSGEFRGRGVGNALLSGVESLAREKGCVRLMLNNRIGAESNTRQFFAKAGYRHRTEFANFVKMLR